MPRSKRSSSGRPNHRGIVNPSESGRARQGAIELVATASGTPCIRPSSSCSCSRTRPRPPGVPRREDGRGALLLLFTLGFIAMMIVPQIIIAIAMNSQPQALRFADTAESFAPLGLFAFALLFDLHARPARRRSTSRPAEVDLLFPAPFSRRELLIYKLGRTAIGLVVDALFFSVCMLDLLPIVAVGLRGPDPDVGDAPASRHGDGAGQPDRRRIDLHAGAQDRPGRWC